jgi:hypothetical protein
MSLDLVKQSPAHWLAQLKCRYLVDKDLPALEWDGEYSHFRRLYRDIYQSTLQGKAIMWVATLAGDEVSEHISTVFGSRVRIGEMAWGPICCPLQKTI